MSKVASGVNPRVHVKLIIKSLLLASLEEVRDVPVRKDGLPLQGVKFG